MKQVDLTTREQWRAWLIKNHDQEKEGIWLVYHKHTASLTYEESVEEALCFGWIDSIIKRIDDDKYCRKFTPRKDDSAWSSSNKARVAKLIREGRMTSAGRAKMDAAKRSGRWDRDPRPRIEWVFPKELSLALARNRKANLFFQTLSPSSRRQFIGWLLMAKKPETKARRLQECLALLEQGKKLGLK